MKNFYIETQQTRRDIDALKIEFPEIADDLDLLRDTIEGSTNGRELLAEIVQRMQEAKAMLGLLRRQLTKRAQHWQAVERAMKGYADKLMETMCASKVELPAATVFRRNTRGKVIVTNLAEIPGSLCTLVRKPNLEKIGELLRNGLCVAGAELSNARPTLAVVPKIRETENGDEGSTVPEQVSEGS